MNANIGVRFKMHRQVIRSHGINNRNKKGRILLDLFSANNLRVMNTFYEKSSYTTWRSFHTTNTCHMLDVITSSFSFSKCIRDCGVTPKGLRSDHSAVQMVFLNRMIKFKSDYVERPVIDWDAIKKNSVINMKFNLLLQKTLQDTHIYTCYG